MAIIRPRLHYIHAFCIPFFLVFVFCLLNCELNSYYMLQAAAGSDVHIGLGPKIRVPA